MLPETLIEQEMELLEIAKKRMGRLLFSDIDVLVIDQMGKEISGAGFDPNITGRNNRGVEGFGDPRVQKIVVLSLSEKTKGNANGMGLADVITRRLFEEIDYPSTYANIISSCYLDGAPVPIPMANDREAIQLAIKTLVRVIRGEERIVRIKDTLSIETISVSEAEDYIFGLVLFNDWSARDIQKWEYVPLGPFLAKNFASSISPWIVTLDALEPFRTERPEQNPAPLPYLQQDGKKSFDIHLEAAIAPKDGDPTTVARSNFKYMYWTMAQQLAHHTINGCKINSGDMMGSGTISGPTPDSYGSMLELAWQGTKPVTLANGETRTSIQDFDTVTMRGYCENNDVRIGFGEVSTLVLPALP